MRKSREETEATRKRIVKTASETFRTNGIAGSALKELMQGAGLETPGGFYKHFGSKEELVTEAISFSISEVLNWMKASLADKTPEKAVETLITNYLSPKHRDRISAGCTFSALGSELRRSNDALGNVTTAGLNNYIALIAKQIKDVPPRVAKKRATAIFSAMVGGLILSRVVNNAALSNTIMKDTREYILDAQRPKKRVK